MADKRWKAAERSVAEVLGGKRNPINGRGDEADVEHDWLAIEVKNRPLPKWIIDGHMQAMKARIVSGKDKLPIVVLKPPRIPVMRGYVLMQMCDFVDYFGDVSWEASHDDSDESRLS